ncbi:putative Condensin-2 complex subunit G2 [Quillaja saponaria]|uniref:Condensin-2 complex subunit G2 n=1 Tax=Quillaja saponaria TaxID=32244 RepID=A0AAD7L704_QUISA|nr:putative Condensin-2 complex subunit G2 [Quillaja saponaria]
MEKRLRSSLQTSAQEFLSIATKQNLKSSKPSLKTIIHSIKSSSDLSSSLPLNLYDSISNSIRSLRSLPDQNPTNPNLNKSPRTPPTKRLRRSARHSKTRVETNPERNGPNLEEEKQKLLRNLEVLAHIAYLCVTHPQNAFPPSALLPAVQSLHNNLILFESDSLLSSGVAILCEEWWKENLPGRESLISQSLPFLLSRSLTLKKKVDVHRICVLREAFNLFDFEDESIEDLKLLLIRCLISPLYLKTEDGRRFLAFLFGLSNQLVKDMVAMIRSQIPYGRKSVLEAYGDVLFRAWKAAEEDWKCEIENGFLQDLIEGAIHASSPAFAASIRKVLGAFINQRTTTGVEKLLFRLAEPVMFRSLQVANSNVRHNALHLLLDMFPFEDPDAKKEVKDNLLDNQFFLLERLLTDDCPDVRVVAVEGACRILHLFWEIIPSPTITKIITKVFDDMSRDSCNEVRLSTLNGIMYLLGNPLSHEVLKVLLPRLGHLMLDNCLSVRMSVADLLLLVKDIQNFQFNKVVGLDILLSALASDEPPIAQKITRLLIPSYFPAKVSIKEACNRCVTLIKRSPVAGARFCEFAILEGASFKHLMELVSIIISVILSPDKLDASQIEGFLLAATHLCNTLASEPWHKNALKELFSGEKVKRLIVAASSGRAQSSLFNIVSIISPADLAGLLEECMDVVTNCSGLPEKVDGQAEVRSAHKLLLSSGGFDDMFEALVVLLQKTAYRCHNKFGIDMPKCSVSSTKRKKFKSAGKISTKWKRINGKQSPSFERDYAIAVGIAWQIKDLLHHQDTRKSILGSQTLELSYFALKIISEASVVQCMQCEYMDTYPVLAYTSLALQMTLHNVNISSANSKDMKKENRTDTSTSLLEKTLLDQAMDHMVNCTRELLGAGLIYTEPRAILCKLKMLTAVLKFMVDAMAVCFASHNHGLLNFTSGCIQHIISSLGRVYSDQIQYKEEDLKDAVLCLKSFFTYAAKLLNLFLGDSTESSTQPPEVFNLANVLLDLITSVESYLGSGPAERLVAAAKPWLPDLILALGSENILRHTHGMASDLTASDCIKLHFPKWPMVLAKTENSEISEVGAEEDENISELEKFPAFTRLVELLIIPLKGSPSIMDAVGVIFLTCSVVGLERKDYGLVLGLLHFVRFKLFREEDRDWGDMMLASLQEIYPKIEREIEETSNADEQEKLHDARELLEPIWMYHLYDTGRIPMTEE